MSFFGLSVTGFGVSYRLVERHVEFVVFFAIAWRPKMPLMSIHSMMTMHYVLQLDRKQIRYGVSWIAAIAASMIGVVAYA